jgi:hypothetical protein
VIAAKIGTDRGVTLGLRRGGEEGANAIRACPILYDVGTDIPLDARELPRNPQTKNLH